METQGDGSVGTESGNTKKRIRSRCWIFTLNNPRNYYPSEEHFFIVLDVFNRWKFSYEIGESGTPHYQGIIWHENLLEEKYIRSIEPSAHWERCRNFRGSINYVEKIETHIAGPWSKGINIIKPIKCITNLYPWQQYIIDLINKEPDDRTIHWFWEPNGNTGKTALCKYICINYKALYVTGKTGDVKYALYKYLEKQQEINCVLFDYSRSQENYISYQALEDVKNGIMFSTKYESGMSIFNSPHVICFANFEPDINMLSLDRWNIINISQ